MLQHRYEFISFPKYFITVVYYYRTHPILLVYFFSIPTFLHLKIFFITGENGFGNLTGEFWLGLSKMHRLNKEGSNTLRVDITDDLMIQLIPSTLHLVLETVPVNTH